MLKIEKLFPVQTQAIPVINNTNNNQSFYPNDLCVLAPTGSGKTLTYVLPIINSLKMHVRPCCRAIVILPVSDLAEQVFNVFKESMANCLDESECLKSVFDECDANVAKSSSLKVVLLSNKNSFAKEQAQLIDAEHGKCLIDIVVATPGRLVDHIQKTRGFNLDQLRYLVLDECDRIMEHIKQNWLEILNQALFANRRLITNENLNVHNLFVNKEKLLPFQKILLSATLTRNPEKLEQVKLFQPLYFSVGAEKLLIDERVIEKQSAKMKKLQPDVEKMDVTPAVQEAKNPNEPTEVNIPTELKEMYVSLVLQQKPLTAIHLIKNLGYRRMLCFVNSIDTAKRLNKLLQLNGINSMEFSSSLHAARRTRIKTKFEAGKLDVLVCSDVMARGMDLVNVDYVLLYDAPRNLSSYVHKIGRTARAGRAGVSIAFLEHREVHFFKKLVLKIAPDHFEKKISQFKIKKSDFNSIVDGYKESLLKLKEELNKKTK